MAKASKKGKKGSQTKGILTPDKKYVKNMVSIIVTVKNEAKHMRDLLDSLVVQEEPYEVLIVDAASTDGTIEIVKEYMEDYDTIKLYRYAAPRGASRNYGIRESRGEYIAFTDGDCIANPFWLKELRYGATKADIVGGKTLNMGYEPFVELSRVELFYKGVDVTMPSCNLLYKREIFYHITGFDDKFITAEDMDLNVRAVNAGYKSFYNDKAIIYHRARSTFVSFLKQAYWNGLGRKQLAMKHGQIWGSYDYSMLFKNRVSFWYMMRMGIALMGYLSLKFLPFKQYVVERDPTTQMERAKS